MSDATTQVYRVYIKSTPQAIWDAITTPEISEKYGYGGLADYELRPGGRARNLWSKQMQEAYGMPELATDGEVIEVDPPHKRVQTWNLAMAPELAAEGFSRVTYEIESHASGLSILTLTHELTDAPKTAALVGGEHRHDTQGGGGGWSWVLSDLKTLLETGSRMEG
jgi:uncharacterized protein YndB with AHSA1/START domain